KGKVAMTRSRKRLLATIDEHGLTLAAPPPALRKLFQVRRRVARTPRDGSGTVLVAEPEKLYFARQDNGITLPRGAWRFLEHAAHRFGFDLSVIHNRDVRFARRPEHPSASDEMALPTTVAEYLAQKTYGLLTYGSNWTLIDTIAEIVKSHPGQSI